MVVVVVVVVDGMVTLVILERLLVVVQSILELTELEIMEVQDTNYTVLVIKTLLGVEVLGQLVITL
jgi:hypothetical protein